MYVCIYIYIYIYIYSPIVDLQMNPCLCVWVSLTLLLLSALWKNKHMVCDRYCGLPSKETWIMPQYQSHASQTEYACLDCSPCSFIVLDMRICDMRCCFAAPYKSSNTRRYCAMLWSGHCLLQHHWIAWQWAEWLLCSLSCSLLFYPLPPSTTSPNQHGDSLKLTRRTHGVTTTSSYRHVSSNLSWFEKARVCYHTSAVQGKKIFVPDIH